MEASRPAAAHDLPRVLELARLLRSELAPMKGGGIWSVRESHRDPEATYSAMLADDDAHLAVGTVDGVVVGFAAVRLERLHTGEVLGVITDLFVEPGAREVGVGERLAVSLVAFCEDRECVGIDAFALPGHRATKNFFEEFGFTARALVMHRRLRGEADGSA